MVIDGTMEAEIANSIKEHGTLLIENLDEIFDKHQAPFMLILPRNCLFSTKTSMLLRT